MSNESEEKNFNFTIKNAERSFTVDIDDENFSCEYVIFSKGEAYYNSSELKSTTFRNIPSDLIKVALKTLLENDKYEIKEDTVTFHYEFYDKKLPIIIKMNQKILDVNEKLLARIDYLEEKIKNLEKPDTVEFEIAESNLISNWLHIGGIYIIDATVISLNPTIFRVKTYNHLLRHFHINGACSYNHIYKVGDKINLPYYNIFKGVCKMEIKDDNDPVEINHSIASALTIPLSENDHTFPNRSGCTIAKKRF